jgi:hypothetical protein
VLLYEDTTVVTGKIAVSMSIKIDAVMRMELWSSELRWADAEMTRTNSDKRATIAVNPYSLIP